MKSSINKTIFRQFLFYIIIFGAIVSIFTFLIIEYFFNQYYYNQQEAVLVEHSHELVEIYNDDGIEELENVMGTYAAHYNMSVQLFSGNNILCGTQGQGSGRGGMSHNSDLSSENLNTIFISRSDANKNDLTSLSFLLKTDDGNFLLTKISFESMDAAVSLVKQFLLFLFIILSVLFVVFGFVYSKKMSKPLQELNSLASKMVQLDFSLRYEDKRVDEIGQLGGTLNVLTQKLEKTIFDLRKELKKEKTLEKMRRMFTAQVSHELQTPLSVIKGYSEALSDDLFKDKEKSQAYDVLLLETNKISKMVDDLLDLSQMESGLYVVHKETFDMEELVSRIYMRYKNLADKYNIILKIEKSSNQLYYGDPLRIEQAIDNILANAVKYVSPNGDILISFTQQEKEISLSITNDGGKIDDNDLPNIFNSYYQGSSAIYGTGLGLAITKHIIELHSGKISASNIETGVKIQLLLPVLQV